MDSIVGHVSLELTFKFISSRFYPVIALIYLALTWHLLAIYPLNLPLIYSFARLIAEA
ncbi:hypothetical protein [Undibacterium baiyunense]|uniref:Uncharacterized protein n=1 Tax=Undibacterium baiyunense TaxID=2828731 RepID=A0A941DE60_9BURK|nr:hypothetical protein [Undibacterium baiyunense]MBR7745830.1 hypothetical protein [Undibacterium baiyunense]